MKAPLRFVLETGLDFLSTAREFVTMRQGVVLTETCMLLVIPAKGCEMSLALNHRNPANSLSTVLSSEPLVLR